MYRKWYPPVRFVFYPLYRLLRRRLRLPVAVGYLAIWILSGALHGALFLAFERPIGAGVFLLLFIALGLIGTGAIFLKNRRRMSRMMSHVE